MENLDFADWLRDQIEIRDWSQADLARASRISPTQIARILSRERNVGNDAVVAIAHAFKLPPEQVYRAAGILPPAPTPHKLRHGHTVYALKRASNVAQLKAISQNIMHKSIVTTDQIYGNLINDDVHDIISSL